MRVITELIGTSPLLMHSSRLADPDDDFTRKISSLTSKRKRTEDDRREIARLEFLGSLYTNEYGQVVVPAHNVRKCFNEAAKTLRKGRDVSRAVNFVPPLDCRLTYEGPESPDQLAVDPSFRDTTLVGVGKNRVVRTRPRFFPWALTIEWELITNILDFDVFRDIVHSAGIIEGLGDNRINGAGRFKAEVYEA